MSAKVRPRLSHLCEVDRQVAAVHAAAQDMALVCCLFMATPHSGMLMMGIKGKEQVLDPTALTRRDCDVNVTSGR